MMTDLRAFYDTINAEEHRLSASLASDSLGILLRAAINELDWYHYNLSQANSISREQEEEFYLLQIGACRLIALAFRARASFDVPVVTFRRDPRLTHAALTLVSGLGILQHGRRVAQGIEQGLGSVSRTGPTSFAVSLNAGIPDEAHFERAVVDHFNTHSRSSFAALLATKTGKILEAEASKLLEDLVFPWETHFIGYSADPLLDAYFFGLALHEIQLQEGYDAFHFATRFGGVRFQAYVLAATFLLATTRRHQRFAQALVKKDSAVRLENLLTISAETSVLAESLRDAVNYFGSAYDDFEEITLQQAHAILDVLSARRDNTSMFEAPGSPFPIVVQCTATGVIKTLFGAQSEPMRFLLESLRFHHQKEYDRRQQTRELSFQQAMERVLRDAIPHLAFQRSVALRSDGRTFTDIDLAIIDEREGLIVLCQLKHQEPYGANLHAKRTRANRLQKEVRSWMAALDAWATSGGATFSRRFGLGEELVNAPIYRLIVTKHFSHPLRNVDRDPSTTFSTWPQMLNALALVSRAHKEPTLRMLLDTLAVEQQRPAPAYEVEPPSRWSVGELVFEISQRA